jgi:hypothetical protein
MPPRIKVPTFEEWKHAERRYLKKYAANWVKIRTPRLRSPFLFKNDMMLPEFAPGKKEWFYSAMPEADVRFVVSSAMVGMPGAFAFRLGLVLPLDGPRLAILLSRYPDETAELWLWARKTARSRMDSGLGRAVDCFWSFRRSAAGKGHFVTEDFADYLKRSMGGHRTGLAREAMDFVRAEVWGTGRV